MFENETSCGSSSAGEDDVDVEHYETSDPPGKGSTDMTSYPLLYNERPKINSHVFTAIVENRHLHQ